MNTPTLFQKIVAEFIGTFILVFFGVGSVHTATLYGAQVGLWQIAVVWGLAIAFAIFVTGSVSGGHLNPAMTLVFALRRGMPWGEVGPYWAGQFSGAIGAAAFLFILFSPSMEAFEKAEGLKPKSIVTARCFGEYYSSPHSVADWQTEQDWAKKVPMHLAFLAEMFGTAVLAFVVFAIIDPRNPSRPAAHMKPVFIGLTISMLISIIAPLTQAGFNPARDLGPRLFAFYAGWGDTAIPGPNGIGFLTVYVIAPCCGSVLGGLFYDWAIRPALPPECDTVAQK